LIFSLTECIAPDNNNVRETVSSWCKYIRHIAEEHNIEPYAHPQVTLTLLGNGKKFWEVKFSFEWVHKAIAEWPIKMIDHQPRPNILEGIVKW